MRSISSEEERKSKIKMLWRMRKMVKETKMDIMSRMKTKSSLKVMKSWLQNSSSNSKCSYNSKCSNSSSKSRSMAKRLITMREMTDKMEKAWMSYSSKCCKTIKCSNNLCYNNSNSSSSFKDPQRSPSRARKERGLRVQAPSASLLHILRQTISLRTSIFWTKSKCSSKSSCFSSSSYSLCCNKKVLTSKTWTLTYCNNS